MRALWLVGLGLTGILSITLASRECTSNGSESDYLRKVATSRDVTWWLKAWSDIRGELNWEVCAYHPDWPAPTVSVKDTTWLYELRPALVLSPSGRKALNYLGVEFVASVGVPVFVGEMDETVVLLDLNSRTWSQVMSCGTACAIQVADWFGSDAFAVCGETEVPGGKGSSRALCIHVFDLARDSVLTFQGPMVTDDARSRFWALSEKWKRTRFPGVVWDMFEK